MKSYVIKLAWLTTIYLVVYTILAFTMLEFPSVFAMVFVGKAIVLYLVYKALTEKYTSNKKFKHWYEDHPRVV